MSSTASWYDSLSTLSSPILAKVESRESLSHILTRNPCSVVQIPIASERVKLENGLSSLPV